MSSDTECLNRVIDYSEGVANAPAGSYTVSKSSALRCEVMGVGIILAD